MALIEGLLLEVFSPSHHCFLQLLKLSIELITEIIDLVLTLFPVLFYLVVVHFLSQVVLPLGDQNLKLPDFLHQRLELDVGLDLQAVVSYKLEPFFYE